MAGPYDAGFRPGTSAKPGTCVRVRSGPLVGFVNVAWDGGCHAFLLDPTVHPDYRRRGIGSELVRRAVEAATVHGVEWVQVDFDRELQRFYEKAGFAPTFAGLIHVRR